MLAWIIKTAKVINYFLYFLYIWYMRFLILISFVFLTIRVSSQAIINNSYQLNGPENALGLVGFNTFNICVSDRFIILMDGEAILAALAA
jgi:multisubunit Na+/H+ antiporter MnhG subunit